MQQIASTPKEPDAMTVAAKAQYEKVKSETAQAIGEQNLRSQKQQADDAFRHEQLRQKTLYDQEKLDIERAKVFVGAGPEGPTSVDPIEAAKIGVDIHTAHLDATMQSHEMAMRFATDQAKIAQQREAAQLQAQTAQAAQQQPLAALTDRGWLNDPLCTATGASMGHPSASLRGFNAAPTSLASNLAPPCGLLFAAASDRSPPGLTTSPPNERSPSRPRRSSKARLSGRSRPTCAKPWSTNF